LQRKRLMSLGVFLEEQYLPWRRAERKRADEEEKRIRLHFESWFDLPMDEISADRLLEWRRQRINKGISAKTVNRDIACLRSVIRYALVLGTLAENPLEQVKALKVDERSHVRFLSESEELSLRTQLDLREQDKIRRRKSYNATLLGKGQKSRNGPGERK